MFVGDPSELFGPAAVGLGEMMNLLDEGVEIEELLLFWSLVDKLQDLIFQILVF